MSAAALASGHGGVRHAAASEGKLEAVVGLATPATIDSKDPIGRTPLMVAAFWGHKPIVTHLLAAGANVRETDLRGWTALHWACEGGQADTAALLISSPAPPSPALPPIVNEASLALYDADGLAAEALPPPAAAAAAAAAAATDVTAAAAASATTSADDDDKFNEVLPRVRRAPRPAVRHTAVETITEEHDYGRCDEEDDDGRVVPVVPKLNVEAVARKSTRWSNVGARDRDGRTPLHRAAECGNTGVIEVLIEAGADVACIDREGNTALHRAAAAGNVDTLQALLDSRADIDARNGEGHTALEVATASKRDDAIGLLTDYRAFNMH